MPMGFESSFGSAGQVEPPKATYSVKVDNKILTVMIEREIITIFFTFQKQEGVILFH